MSEPNDSLDRMPRSNDPEDQISLQQGGSPSSYQPLITSALQDSNQRDMAARPEVSSPQIPASTVTLPVDLRMLDYVNPCDENLICPICRCPFVDPVILTDCEHCFCRECIRQTWATAPNNSYSSNSNRKECPSCRAPAKLGLRSSTNKILTNILDDMIVICPHSAEGCTAQVKRGEVQDHIALYCGYTMVECLASSCQSLSRRKDSLRGCLHVDLCCNACHGQLQLADLEVHWTRVCPDRAIECKYCSAKTTYRELEEHQKHSCPGVVRSCPGKSLGCLFESDRTESESHAKACPLAALTPIFEAQKKRLDEQEIAQKQMSRRIKILENGVSSMRDILYPPMTTEGNSRDATFPSPFERPPATNSHRPSNSQSANALRDFDFGFGADSSFPAAAADGPFTSPFDHLLSVHETLRSEITRINNALQELEGRQSLQIINENLRTREEMSYLGAQLAGVVRQVHWLTQTQLQQQSRGGTPNAGNVAAAGSSVEAAVSAVNTAVQGAARMMSTNRQSLGTRRGSSEEGRTKL